jgi:hypothetical protein
MPYRANYPRTVAEILNPRRKYKAAVLRALKAFRRAKPWRGTVHERRVKFLELHAALCAVYGKTTALRFVAGAPDCYMPALDAIVMGGLSVVTYLHEFGHALGKDERQTCAWSINLFRRIFPR